MPRGLLARHPDLKHHSSHLDRSGTWERWQEIDRRLASFESLDALTRTWEACRSAPCYPAIAALAGIGSRRGRHDDDAAIAVVVALHRDMDCVAAQLRHVCDPDDLLWAMWDAIQRAEPQLGLRAPYFLLHRAKESLLAAHRKQSCEVACLDMFVGGAGDLAYIGVQPARGPGNQDEGQDADLHGLLLWAVGAGVVAPADAQLLGDVLRYSERDLPVEESLTRAGSRLGVSMRTARRRREATVRRLRDAVPEFSAAAS